LKQIVQNRRRLRCCRDDFHLRGRLLWMVRHWSEQARVYALMEEA
jgi:hypothetical protein